MSMILWCDIHDGGFSSNENGWANMQISMRNGDYVTEVKQMHACRECAAKILAPTPLLDRAALESGKSIGERGQGNYLLSSILRTQTGSAFQPVARYRQVDRHSPGLTKRQLRKVKRSSRYGKT
jgi:hypothetical protein